MNNRLTILKSSKR